MSLFDNYSFKSLIEKILDILYEKEPELFSLDDSAKHVGECAIIFC